MSFVGKVWKNVGIFGFFGAAGCNQAVAGVGGVRWLTKVFGMVGQLFGIFGGLCESGVAMDGP